MKKITVFFLVLILFTMLSARSKFNESTIKAELRKPGVKLVAIDFYMTGCAPCDAAIPEWKKLKKQYGDALKLIVVAPMLDNGSCMVKDWRPDKMICDEDMEIAGSWGVKDFPQAFLYSWHNNDPLVQLGHVKDVEKAIKAYFKEIPRVVLDADSNSRNLLPKVEEALRMNSKIELVSSAAEQKQLLALKKQSHKLNYDEDLKCELGKEISANSVLKITKEDGDLVLRLSSVEKSCTMAAATKSLSGDKQKLKTEVAAAVYELLSQMFGNISTPDEGGKPQKMQKSNFQTGRFGGRSDDWEIGSGEETIVKFESEPTGAVVIADGKILCQSTPCSKMLTQGNHEIEMQKENYVPNSQKQNIKEGQTIKYKLEPDFAWLSVTGNYAVSLKLDGQNIGEIPIKEKPISTGNHRIEHADNCFYDSGETFTVQRGENKNIRFDVEHRESAIKVYAQDEKGNDIDADVYVDDKKVGRAPGTFKVPLCSKEMRVKKSGYRDYSERLSLKEKQVKTFQAKMKSNKPLNRGYTDGCPAGKHRVEHLCCEEGFNFIMEGQCSRYSDTVENIICPAGYQDGGKGRCCPIGNIFIDGKCQKENRPRIQVMEFTGDFSSKILSDSTEYFRTLLVKSKKYIVNMNNEENTGSHNQTNSNRIALSTELSADMIISTSIRSSGNKCHISSKLIDLEKESVVAAATSYFDCDNESSMKEAIQYLANAYIKQ